MIDTAEDAYEDDFETYEDDFESDGEDDGGHTSLPTKSAQGPTSHNEAVHAHHTLPGKASLGLSDVQRNHAAQQWARLQHLAPQVKLQEIVLDNLFDLPAMTEYDLFSMGRGCYRDAVIGSSQTNDDAVADECQTEPIESSSAACQFPDSVSETQHETEKPLQASDSTEQLLPFLRSAGSVILGILGLQQQHKAPPEFNIPAPLGKKGVITQSLILYHPGILEGRAVTATAYRDADGMVLAAYGPSDLQENALAAMGCLCVWDLSSPAMPAKVLLSEGCPTACTFLAAPGRGDLVLAGMQEGGLCLWDCEEAGSRASSCSIDGASMHCQRPTFSSECHGSPGMAGAVVSVAVLPHPPLQPGEQSRAGLKKTGLLALTEWGNVSLWSVHVLASGECSGAGGADAGLSIGGRVGLLLLTASLAMGRGLHAGMQAPTPGHAASSAHTQLPYELERRAAVLSLPPTSMDQYLVGLDSAQTVGGSLYGEAYVPTEWQLEDKMESSLIRQYALRSQTQVTCISFSPFMADVWVAGHTGGIMAVYSLTSSRPMLVMQAGEQDIIAVTWSPTKPSLVMALNSHSQLILLHINSQTCQPKVYDFVNTTSSSKGTKAAITVSACLVSAG
ncbi:TPA: hypothetical protein ACH3X1_016247 [Trebouxia sp. C0004]